MQSAGFIATFNNVGGRATLCPAAVGWSMLLIALATVASAQGARQVPLGVAWEVKGQWRADGQTTPLQTGDAIKPGSLLTPVVGSPAHSITILLPDGQRIFYECFQAEDCGRGFRVPSIYRDPDPKAGAMLWRIHAVLATRGRQPEFAPRNGSPLPRDEVVAVLNAQSRCEVAGLVAALPDGQYTYTERALGQADALPIRKTIEKHGASLVLDIPSPGLYDLIITDSLHMPRVDLLIAAVKEPRAAKIQDSFRNAKVLLKDWNEDSQGWPVHDFQRAYLEALIFGINPPIPSALSVAAGSQQNRPDVVAEPFFTPKPGVFKGDTTVTLRCDTPGATIHFTTDNSQPFTSSPVYSAPITVKGTAMTIKAFAIAKGKGQSSVVAGIFRVGD